MKQKVLRSLADKYVAVDDEHRAWLRSKLTPKDSRALDCELRRGGDTRAARAKTYREEERVAGLPRLTGFIIRDPVRGTFRLDGRGMVRLYDQPARLLPFRDGAT